MRVLFCIPERDFDPTEAAVPWRLLTAAGHDAFFATPRGRSGAADPHMLDGMGLDPWGCVPGLDRIRLMGLLLRADRRARAAYALMVRDERFRHPFRYDELRESAFDALVLPGGHYARGMREYLESPVLQQFVASVFDAGKPVAAICHGVVLASRCVSSRTGRSVLYGKRTTALTWSQERLAQAVGRIVRFWEPTYYRTYADGRGEPPGYRSVQSEVTRALAAPGDFRDVPRDAPDARRKTDGRHRDSEGDPRPAWVVRDGSYVSARWPGDAHTFAKTFLAVLAEAG